MQEANRQAVALTEANARAAQQWALNIHLARVGLIAGAISPRAGNRRQRPPADDKLARKRRKTARASRKRNRA